MRPAIFAGGKASCQSSQRTTRAARSIRSTARIRGVPPPPPEEILTPTSLTAASTAHCRALTVARALHCFTQCLQLLQITAVLLKGDAGVAAPAVCSVQYAVCSKQYEVSYLKNREGSPRICVAAGSMWAGFIFLTMRWYAASRAK